MVGWDPAHKINGIPELVGRTVSKVRRLHYTFKGNTDRRTGDIELTFADGYVLLCSVNADWTLSFYDDRWVDLVLQPDFEGAAEYVAQYGKWDAFDVTNELPYSQVVGQTIRQIAIERNEFSELVGLRLRGDGAEVHLQNGENLSVSLKRVKE